MPCQYRRRIVSARAGYTGLVGDIAGLLESARRASARTVNAFMTATYWEVGHRIVEFEQGGSERAEYGKELMDRLAVDLTKEIGRGFSRQNLQNMRQFFLAFSVDQIRQTLSGKSPQVPIQTTPGESRVPVVQTKSGVSPQQTFALGDLARAFPLPWSHYVLLLGGARSPEAREFYHAEALRGGWSVRQLRRQIDSQFYERTALSINKSKILCDGSKAQSEDVVSADEEVKDPLVLEFLGLREEYSESDLEHTLIRHLEHFLLELGNDFAFVARQRRLRIDDEWYRVDLLLFHRRLRCLVVIDLKLGRFNHADAGQMHLYLNYAREHWTQPDEQPPVGLILCSGKGEALVRYATNNLPSKVVVREYLTALPNEKRLAAEIGAARKKLEVRRCPPLAQKPPRRSPVKSIAAGFNTSVSPHGIRPRAPDIQIRRRAGAVAKDR
jgi:predicted nuclease of restriction endonuclease-like (RecB) superfamily